MKYKNRKRNAWRGFVLRTGIWTLLLAPITLIQTSREVVGSDATPILAFSLGPLSVRPQLFINQSFSDNLFSSSIRIGDEVTVFEPGLDLQLGKPSQNMIRIGYRSGHRFYGEHHELDGGDDRLLVNFNYRGPKLTLAASESFGFLTEPVGSFGEYRPLLPDGGSGAETAEPAAPPTPVAGASETLIQVPGKSIDHSAYSGSFLLTYGLSEKTALYLQATHSAVNYQARISLLDQSTIHGTLGYRYQAFPKIGIFGEAYFGKTESQSNGLNGSQPDASFFGGAFGVHGRFSEKISGDVRLGYGAQSFAGQVAAPDSPVVNASLSYKLSPKRNLTLSMAREQSVSSQYARSSYVLDSLTARVNQTFGTSQKWSASVGGNFSRYNYSNTPGAGRDYNRYSGDLTVRYQIQRWLAANMSYTFTAIRRSSSITDEYTANQLSLNLAIGY